ncbi:ELMO domain-containing protein [Pseudoscourfieldia marina]
MADVDDLEINLDDLIGGDDASGAPSQQPALGPAAALSAASSTSKQAVMFAQAAAPGGTSLGAHAAGGFDEAGGAASANLFRQKAPKSSDAKTGSVDLRPSSVPVAKRPKTFANQGAGSALKDKNLPEVGKSNALRDSMFTGDSVKANSKPAAPEDSRVVVGSLTGGGAADDDDSDDDSSREDGEGGGSSSEPNIEVPTASAGSSLRRVAEEDDDDEFAYALEGGVRKNIHKEKFEAKPMPRELQTVVHGVKLEALVEEGDEEEEEEEEEQHVADKEEATQEPPPAPASAPPPAVVPQPKPPQSVQVPPKTAAAAPSATESAQAALAAVKRAKAAPKPPPPTVPKPSPPSSAAAAAAPPPKHPSPPAAHAAAAPPPPSHPPQPQPSEGPSLAEFDAAAKATEAEMAAAAAAGETGGEVRQIAHPAALQYFCSQDLAKYAKDVQVEAVDDDEPLLSRIMKALLGMCGAGNTPLNDAVLIHERLCVFSLAKVSFADEAFKDQRKMHFRILATIFMNFTSKKRAPERYGGHWDEVGFQGNDPATDLRGCGMLGLVHLLLMSSANLMNARNLFELSRDPVQNFPLAIVSINVTRYCLQALRAGRLNRAAMQSQSMWRVVNDFYLGMMYEFYTRWLGGGKTMKESGFVLADMEKHALTAPASAILDNAKASYFGGGGGGGGGIGSRGIATRPSLGPATFSEL